MQIGTMSLPLDWSIKTYSGVIYIQQTDQLCQADHAKNSVFLYSLGNGSLEQIEQGLADLILKADSTETIIDLVLNRQSVN